MFFVLYSKHLLFYSRNWKGTALQILFPLFLFGVLSWLATIISVQRYDETSYPSIPFPVSNPSSYLAQDPFMKDCKNNYRGGKVALAPLNPLTELISTILQNLYGIQSDFFQTD